MSYALVSDIGGTKSNFAVFSLGKELKQIYFESIETNKLKDIVSFINEILRKVHIEKGIEVTKACFGVAGLVAYDKSYAKLTNLSLKIDVKDILNGSYLSEVLLLNDLEALGYAVADINLYDERIVPLLGNFHERKVVSRAPKAIIAAGTGLGMGVLHWDSRRKKYLSYHSEGGHMDFAPKNDEEYLLMKFLQKEGMPISFERLVSGVGFRAIYSFFRMHLREESDIVKLIDNLDSEEQASLIQKNVSASKTCHKTIDLFIDVYARAARNLALFSLPRGGVFIGGGIAPKMLDHLKEPHFIDSFVENKVLSSFLKSLPVFVIKDPNLALEGCAYATKYYIDRCFRP